MALSNNNHGSLVVISKSAMTPQSSWSRCNEGARAGVTYEVLSCGIPAHGHLIGET